MAGIKDFQQAANILQDVDVSEIFTSLAMGIAEAQEKLDNNSIAQILKLSEQQIAGKSLVELGFVPAFYSFTEATISASINLKMAMKEDFSIEAKINANYNSNNNLTKDESDFASENKYSKGYSSYTSSKSVTMRASEKSAIKIENEVVNIKQEEGCYSMIEKFEDKILENEKYEEVVVDIHSEQTIENQSRLLNINMMNGYVCISKPHVPTGNYGVLKITDYATDKAIDVDDSATAPGKFELVTSGSTVNPNQSFEDSIAAAKLANGGVVYGFSKDGKFYDGVNPAVDLVIYFKHDNETATSGKKVRLGDRIYFDTNVSTTGDATPNVENKGSLLNVFKMLNSVLMHTGETIEITGETDSSGDDTYNLNLGKRRALALKNLFKSLGSKETSLGETVSKKDGNNIKNALYRKAYIKLNADYIVFEGGAIDADASPAVNATTKNKFIVLKDGGFFATGGKQITYGQNNITFTTEDTLEHIKTDLEAKTQDYLFEIKHERLYMLNKAAMLKFSVFSKNSQKMSIEKVESRDDENRVKEDSVKIDEVFNQSSSIKNDVSNTDKSNSFAIGGSVDVRYARQFEMSMEGTASMSAKLVAVDAPDGFKEFVIKNLK